MVQKFDTVTGKYLCQDFIAGDQVDYENPLGDTIEPTVMEEFNFGPYASEEPYLPFNMVQPN